MAGGHSYLGENRLIAISNAGRQLYLKCMQKYRCIKDIKAETRSKLAMMGKTAGGFDEARSPVRIQSHFGYSKASCSWV